ncbi:MAG TPA: O-methyltransferase [Ignavibacteria bacterium]|nr:O-methyltransferase [Ignavibacteria bacterium]
MKGVPLNEDIYNYIVNTFAEEDDILKNIVRETEAKKFPLIQVSPELGKFLYMLIRIIRSKRVLEIGTLAGYSTVWMARALPEVGKLTTLEISREHAEFAKSNFIKAGLENKIEVLFGNAVESLDKLKNERFDFAFIDADKTGYPDYFYKVIQMMNPGGIITADNTLKKGKVVEENPDEYVRGILEYNRIVSSDNRVESVLVPISDGLTVSWVK